MAVRLDASGDFLRRTTALPDSLAYTAMGWFYVSVDRGNTGQVFLGLEESSPNGIYLYHKSLSLKVWNGSAESTGTTISLATWYHLAIVGNGTGAGSLKTYLNGVEDISTTNYSFTESDLFVGNSRSSEWLNGRAGAVKVYDAALGVEEIRKDMRQTVPARFANLHIWSPLRNTGEQLIDYSGNGKNWTLGGTLATEDGPPIPWTHARPRLIIPTSAPPAFDPAQYPSMAFPHTRRPEPELVGV